MAHQPKIIGYDGPSGPYAVVSGKTLPLTDPRVMLALVDSTLLTGLGSSEQAGEYQQLARNRAEHTLAK